MTEREYDKKLKIDTCGRDAYKEDQLHHPYEPTPYSVLARLAESGYITEDNHLVDYGCGKGRAAFLLNDMTGCRATGVDFDPRMIDAAEENLANFFLGNRKPITFVCEDASHFLPEDGDRFYFFNPFDVRILRSVLGNIINQSYCNPEPSILFFYYPDEETEALLMSTRGIAYTGSIDTRDLFDGDNKRERIMIFTVE